MRPLRYLGIYPRVGEYSWNSSEQRLTAGWVDSQARPKAKGLSAKVCQAALGPVFLDVSTRRQGWCIWAKA